ncbi:hypothetical protein, partial [Corallococcus sp. CA041A]|uniref:hypothetical protein n=1 Tax=Corallococcus sp. CA041A TaxID=2316727 RepID=UPI001F45D898
MIRSLNIDHIIARFSSQENGPRDSWFLLLMSSVIPGKINARLKTGHTAFWDLARIHDAYP